MKVAKYKRGQANYCLHPVSRLYRMKVAKYKRGQANYCSLIYMILIDFINLCVILTKITFFSCLIKQDDLVKNHYLFKNRLEHL